MSLHRDRKNSGRSTGVRSVLNGLKITLVLFNGYDYTLHCYHELIPGSHKGNEGKSENIEFAKES